MKTKWQQYCEEIDRDYSILSDEARNRLKVMLMLIAEDAQQKELNKNQISDLPRGAEI